MPSKNHFRHQTYSNERPKSRFELMKVPFPAQEGTTEYDEVMRKAGAVVSENVDAVYLIHGTFAGNDALGWTAQIERLWPKAADQLRGMGKKLVDVLADDAGNYTQRYAKQIQLVFQDSGADTKVHLFHWSGENNHAGRVVAAIELLDLLFQRIDDQKRVLLMCHSHAGNVLALVTSLLGASDEQRRAFLEVVRPIYRDEGDKDILGRVTGALQDPALRQSLILDVVTLGTPIRYGWDASGYRNLLHFVHHVPKKGQPEYLSPVPELKSRDLLKMDGDFVQQFGIAGTNFFPYILDLPLLLTEQKLGKLLQPFGRKNFWDNLKMGMRVPDEGETLLVEYDDEKGLAHKLAGHAVYTQSEWLVFHLCEIVRRFYG